MEADDRPLVGVERVGLEQDPIRDAQLAEVVEHRRPADLRRRDVAKARALREPARRELDPPDVLAGVRVARLGGLREGEQALALALDAVDDARGPVGGVDHGSIEEAPDERPDAGERRRANEPLHRALDPVEAEPRRHRPEHRRDREAGQQPAAPAECVRGERDRGVAELHERAGRAAGQSDEDERDEDEQRDREGADRRVLELCAQGSLRGRLRRRAQCRRANPR